MKRAIHNVNSFKASGPSGVNTAMNEDAGYCGVKMMREIVNDVLLNNTLPKELNHSSLDPLYKVKGDTLSLNSYRGIKTLEHGFKTIEKLLETRSPEANPNSRCTIWVHARKRNSRCDLRNKANLLEVIGEKQEAALDLH